MTLPEVVLWNALRGGRLNGMRFRRQHPVGPYVLDFYCPARRLAVEVDGLAHDSLERFERDSRRDAWLSGKGVMVMRFLSTDVLRAETFEAVLQQIRTFADPPP